MLKKFAAVTVFGAILLSQCGLDEPDQAPFSEGQWREITTLDVGISTYFITVAGDSFHLEDRLWTDIPQCSGTSCSGPHQSTFVKGTIAVPGDQMVTLTGSATDSLFSPLTDTDGNQIPYYELYMYTWIDDTLILVKGSEQRKMVKE